MACRTMDLRSYFGNFEVPLEADVSEAVKVQ